MGLWFVVALAQGAVLDALMPFLVIVSPLIALIVAARIGATQGPEPRP